MGAIIQVDATPFRQWYEAHVSAYRCNSLPQHFTVLSCWQYAQPVTKKGAKTQAAGEQPEKKSNHVQRKLEERKKGKV